MTASVFGEATSCEAIDPYSPEHVSPLVAYLASPQAESINGQVFVVYGGMVALLAAPVVEQRFDANGDTWDLDDLGQPVGASFAAREDQSRSFSADSLMHLNL